jgi:hypothetical protein
MTPKSLVPFVLVSLLACAGDEEGPSPQQLEEREVASRQACIAERLASRASDELRTLEGFGAVTGPLAFQQAYTQHADLRLAAYAQLDSALNRASTPDDSLRHERAAGGYQLRIPESGSVEENVIRSYETNFAVIFNDSDHPCNWQSELEAAD